MNIDLPLVTIFHTLSPGRTSIAREHRPVTRDYIPWTDERNVGIYYIPAVAVNKGFSSSVTLVSLLMDVFITIQIQLISDFRDPYITECGNSFS